MNPYITLSGTAVDQNKSVYIHRVTSTVFRTVSITDKPINSGDLKLIIPDGAKILSMKIMSLTGRSLTVTIPPGSGLVLTEAGAQSGAQNASITRADYAPLTRLPRIKINIPDLIARNLDVDSSNSLFTIRTDVSADVVLRFHYKLAI